MTDTAEAMQTTRRHLFIGGEWVEPDGTDVIEIVSPHTEQVIGPVPHASTADVDRAVVAARRAFDEGPWPQRTPAERADVMTAISAALEAKAEGIARLITLQNGSPISWSVGAQAWAAIMALDYYTGLARTYAFSEERPGALGPTTVRREPVGVVGAIVPWNVPLFVTMLKVAPALAAGCTVVLKPAPETPLDAYVLAEIAADAGLPEGVLNVVPAGREVGEHIVRHRPRPPRRRDDEQRRGLRGPDPHPRPPVTVRRGGRRSGRGRPGPGRGRPARPGHHGRPPGGRAPAGPGGGLHRQRPRRGRQGGDRRRPPGRPRHGLVRRAHGVRGRGQRHDDRPGGDQGGHRARGRHRAGPELTERLLSFCEGRLARFKLPRSVDDVHELPRDPNGKLYKRRLRDPYWQARDRAI